MKISKVILENFRSYVGRTEIDFTDLTAFIGKNDAGKSTILEALDIFFEGGSAKPEPSDASISGDARQVKIGVVFNDIPDRMTLDSGAESSLAAEYLLNSDGLFEVHKIYDMSVQTVKAPKTYALALHPTEGSVEHLLKKKNTELKALIDERNLQDNCNKRENPSMRQALYAHVPNLGLTEQLVSLDDENGKAVWGAIQKYVPLFVLFKSDRPSSDQDPEVQNPMKVAIEKALSEIEDDLQEIAEKVEKKARETANRTVQQLQKSYPDLASTLVPNFKKPSWKSIFKLDLESDNGIPLNKRGSGVRRLVLLSFFQAEAERKRQEKLSGNPTNDIPVIYAIEEPETSQHPDSQREIIKALLELSRTGNQVLVTTHVPELAGLIPLESLRFVDKNSTTNVVEVRNGTDDVYQEIADTLGILPSPIKEQGIKVAVCIEGVTDYLAINSLTSVLIAANELTAIDFSKVFWVPTGGDGLKAWIEHRYLDTLGVPQIYIFDSDKTSATDPLSNTKASREAELNSRTNCTVFITKKREIDNYVHNDAIERATANNISLSTLGNLDYVDITAEFDNKMKAAISNGYTFNPTDSQGNPIPVRSRKIKHILTDFIMSQMTADEIKNRFAYTANDGTQKHEIIDWLEEIRKHISPQATQADAA